MASYRCISVLRLIHGSYLGINTLPELRDFACIHP
jgi:hypothetical protein